MMHSVSRDLFAPLPKQRMFAARARVATTNLPTARFFSALGGSPDVTLYQYAICPFCHKAKALLAYADVDHDVVEVNPLSKSEIQWSKEYKKVPIAKLNEEPLLGSDAILDGLLADETVTSKLQVKWNGTSMNMETFRSEKAKQWVNFANDELAALLYPNICRTLGDSYQAFGYVDNVQAFSAFQRLSIRLAGSAAMYFAASRVKKKRNISDERAALDTVLTKLETDGLGNATGFISGADTPDLGDVAVYGTLRSIEGLGAHDQFVLSRQGVLSEWYSRMKMHIEAN